MSEERYETLNLGSRLPKRRVVFAWDMHYSCNYRCPYCFYTHAGWTELAKKNLYKTPAEWEAVWRRVYDRYGACQLRITAGEPFTYPRFAETVVALSRWHDLQITTNGSFTEAIRRVAREADPARVELDCTFHPIWGEFESFSENVLTLRRAGFVANVCFLAYPPQMARMAEYKKRFAAKGLYMNMAIFWGKIRDKQYPFAYTEEERRWIKEVIGCEVSAETVNLDPIPINGKVCGAGQRYAVVQADGRVFRCGQLGHEDQSIGSIFDENFSLFPQGLPCAADYCRCKEFQSAWEDEDCRTMNEQNAVLAGS